MPFTYQNNEISMKLFKSRSIAAAAGLLFCAAGCASQDVAPEVKPPPAQAQIQSIQNNPNMPPQAKEAAIAAIQRTSQTGGQPPVTK